MILSVVERKTREEEAWEGEKRRGRFIPFLPAPFPADFGDWRHAVFEVLALSWLSDLAKPFRCSSPRAPVVGPRKFSPQGVAPPTRRNAKPVPFAIAGVSVAC